MMRSFDRKPGALAKAPAATVLVMDLILLIGWVLAKRRKISRAQWRDSNLIS